MEYPLHFFDDLIDNPNRVKVHKLNLYADNNIASEIRENAISLKKNLRNTYYSFNLKEDIDTYLEKILKRLTLLKIKTEQLLVKSRKSYLLFYTEKLWSWMSYYHLLLEEFKKIGTLYELEFEKPDNELQKSIIKQVNPTELSLHAEKLRYTYVNFGILDEKIINSYSLDEGFIDDYTIFIPTIADSKTAIPKEMPPNKPEDTLATETCDSVKIDYKPTPPKFIIYYKEFVNNYLKPIRVEDNRPYFAARRKVKKEFHRITATKGLTEKEKQTEKIHFLEDFLLHTSLCADITFGYFSDKIRYIEGTDKDYIEEYLDGFYNRIQQTKAHPKYQVYQARDFEEPLIDIKDVIWQQAVPYEYKQLRKHKNESYKITWNGTPREFIEWIHPYFRSRKAKNKKCYLEINGVSSVSQIIDTLYGIFSLTKEDGTAAKTSSLITYFRELERNI